MWKDEQTVAVGEWMDTAQQVEPKVQKAEPCGTREAERHSLEAGPELHEAERH